MYWLDLQCSLTKKGIKQDFLHVDTNVHVNNLKALDEY